MKEILTELCKTRQYADRIVKIVSFLPSGVKLDYYHTGINIYYTTDYGKSQTVLLTSHHDILDKHSDNCLDNNASIYNLITLAWQLKKSEYNLIFAFVDEEESGGGGIIRATKQFKFDLHLDFELTAFGKDTVFAKYGTADGLPNLQEYKMPPNNSFMAYKYLKSQSKDYAGYCLTTLNNNGEYPEHWSYIHSSDDKLELANHEDMENFRSKIASLLTQKICRSLVF